MKLRNHKQPESWPPVEYLLPTDDAAIEIGRVQGGLPIGKTLALFHENGSK